MPEGRGIRSPKLPRLAAVLISAFPAACALPPAVSIASLATSAATDAGFLALDHKMPSDALISAAAKKDCALYRLLLLKPICRKERVEVTQQTAAKRSLAGADPDPDPSAFTDPPALIQLPQDIPDQARIVWDKASPPAH